MKKTTNGHEWTQMKTDRSFVAWASIMIPANRVRSAQRTLPNDLRRRVRCADRPRVGAPMAGTMIKALACMHAFVFIRVHSW